MLLTHLLGRCPKGKHQTAPVRPAFYRLEPVSCQPQTVQDRTVQMERGTLVLLFLCYLNPLEASPQLLERQCEPHCPAGEMVAETCSQLRPRPRRSMAGLGFGASKVPVESRPGCPYCCHPVSPQASSLLTPLPSPSSLRFLPCEFPYGTLEFIINAFICSEV